jgi:putative RecB family exonuclease
MNPVVSSTVARLAGHRPPPRSVPPEPTTPGPLDYLSASRLNCWQQCRLKFWFRYVARIESKPSPALLVGQAVHRVLQAWNQARWRGEQPSANDLRETFASGWTELAAEYAIPWTSVDNETAHRDQAWALFSAYLAETFIPPDEKPEGVEVSVEAELDGLPRLVGVIDLVRAGGRIVDFKTSARTPGEGQVAHLHETQLACYAVLYREATGTTEQALELHHLVKLKTPKVVITVLDPMTELQEARLRLLMNRYVEGVLAGDFLPSPGLHCMSCDYFGRCRKWHPRELERRTA